MIRCSLVLLVLSLGCVYPVPYQRAWVHPQGNQGLFLSQAHVCMQEVETEKQFDQCMMDEGWEQLLITGRTTTRRKLSPTRVQRSALADACPGVLVCAPGVCSCYTNTRKSRGSNPYGDESWKMSPSRNWERWETERPH